MPIYIYYIPIWSVYLGEKEIEENGVEYII